MALMEFHDQENALDQIAPVKQFVASGTKPFIKKKALADVKNTIHQKCVQSEGKPSGSITKPAKIKGNDVQILESDNHKANKLMNQVDLMNFDSSTEDGYLIVESVCPCYEKREDDYADVYFKQLKLGKQEIEDHALNWECPPTFSGADKRELLAPQLLAVKLTEPVIGSHPLFLLDGFNPKNLLKDGNKDLEQLEEPEDFDGRRL